MRVESVLFAAMRSAEHERMARVLEASAAENSPNTPLTVHRIDSPDHEIIEAGRGAKLNYVNNTRKTKHHARIVQSASDGELLCLIDTDTMILKDLLPVESMDFDLAITLRPPGSQYWCNTGVVFVRVSDAMRFWFQRWYAAALMLLENRPLYLRYRKRHGGINQSALAMLMEQENRLPRVAHLDCVEWNLESESHDLYDPERTRVVHLLGNLRNACIHGERPKQHNRELVKKFREYERAAV